MGSKLFEVKVDKSKPDEEAEIGPFVISCECLPFGGGIKVYEYVEDKLTNSDLWNDLQSGKTLTFYVEI